VVSPTQPSMFAMLIAARLEHDELLTLLRGPTGSPIDLSVHATVKEWRDELDDDIRHYGSHYRVRP
jgi:hypothetical protein